jgi:hypothetical protein
MLRRLARKALLGINGLANWRLRRWPLRAAQMMSLFRQFVLKGEAAWENRTHRALYLTGVDVPGAGKALGVFNRAREDLTLAYAMMRALGTGSTSALDAGFVDDGTFGSLAKLHRVQVVTTQAAKASLFKLICRSKGGGVPQDVAQCLWANKATDGVGELFGYMSPTMTGIAGNSAQCMGNPESSYHSDLEALGSKLSKRNAFAFLQDNVSSRVHGRGARARGLFFGAHVCGMVTDTVFGI